MDRDMRTLVNKKIFEEWLEAQIGKYMVNEVNEVLIYKIVDAHNIQFQNNIFSILDSEMEGIKIQFSLHGKIERVFQRSK